MEFSPILLRKIKAADVSAGVRVADVLLEPYVELKRIYATLTLLSIEWFPSGQKTSLGEGRRHLILR